MRRTVLIAMAAAGAAVAAVAATPKLGPEEQLARLTHGAVPGKPQTCISGTFTQTSQTIDGVGIVYRAGRTYYLNRLGGDCPLRQTDILVSEHHTGQFCRGDIARVLESASQIPKGSCVYGDFVPYKLAR